jgi:hypothetical protein
VWHPCDTQSRSVASDQAAISSNIPLSIVDLVVANHLFPAEEVDCPIDGNFPSAERLSGQLRLPPYGHEHVYGIATGARRNERNNG